MSKSKHTYENIQAAVSAIRTAHDTIDEAQDHMTHVIAHTSGNVARAIAYLNVAGDAKARASSRAPALPPGVNARYKSIIDSLRLADAFTALNGTVIQIEGLQEELTRSIGSAEELLINVPVPVAGDSDE